LETLIADEDELTPIKEIVAKMPAVVDAFHIYASMLKTFRSARQVAIGPPAPPEPLTAAADNERELLRCRADLRESMQQLIAVLQAGL